MSDEQLIQNVMKPSDDEYIMISTHNGRAVNGNTRLYELQRRG
ncbi:hypothetical protein LX64_02670 [Chitinophaga skermanii]|uniref:Uncharacterized protein n=1 Tax=Chitinophaga skermanii TaxID=331697 RepID=A0A327QMF1_9BACT|nr:hypothetical protein LX64_02670 [Chitinophaga skermanii]